MEKSMDLYYIVWIQMSLCYSTQMLSSLTCIEPAIIFYRVDFSIFKTSVV